MNREEYAEYEATVARYLRGLEAVSTGACAGCEECGIPEGEENYASEPFFSWTPCEICGSSLGGNREYWHAVIPATRQKGCVHENGAMVHGQCCEDCVCYLNYGRLDDMAMLEIERS